MTENGFKYTQEMMGHCKKTYKPVFELAEKKFQSGKVNYRDLAVIEAASELKVDLSPISVDILASQLWKKR